MTSNIVVEDTPEGTAEVPLVVLSNEPAVTQAQTEHIGEMVVPTQNSDIIDNGIFDFMTPERAIELYTMIHAQGLPDLKWKFYGRCKPDGQTLECNDSNKNKKTEEATEQPQDIDQETIMPTAFDFDESFSDLHTEEPAVNDSLQLKRRSEPGSERKTNLSDIMSNIIKETNSIEND